MSEKEKRIVEIDEYDAMLLHKGGPKAVKKFLSEKGFNTNYPIKREINPQTGYVKYIQ